MTKNTANNIDGDQHPDTLATEPGELQEADLEQASGGVGGSKCNAIIHE